MRCGDGLGVIRPVMTREIVLVSRNAGAVVRVRVYKLAFFILTFSAFSGCTAIAEKTDVNEPQIWKDENITLPANGLTVSSALYLKGRVNITGGAMRITRKGRLIIEKNSDISITGVTIVVAGATPTEGNEPNYLISVRGGAKTSFTAANNNILINTPYSDRNLESPWDQPPLYWLFGMPRKEMDEGGFLNLAIKNNKLVSSSPYSTGAIAIRQIPGESVSPTLTGEISQNEFNGFHGVIALDNLRKFHISDNRLLKNNYANIFAGGEEVEITENKIYYPGNGTTGDGITVIGKLKNSRIDGNTIFDGSCYGILIRGSEITRLQISNNTILNGITTAIQLDAIEKPISDITVKGNIISGNKGFAVTFVGVRDSSIEHNHFTANAPGFPAQIYVERSPHLTVTGNLSAPPLTPEWASKLELNRTHVFSDDSTFTLPDAQAE